MESWNSYSGENTPKYYDQKQDGDDAHDTNESLDGSGLIHQADDLSGDQRDNEQLHSSIHAQMNLHDIHSAQNTPVIRSETPLLQSTPQAPESVGDGASSDAFSDQMFLHHLEQNLYHPIDSQPSSSQSQLQSQQQQSQHSAAALHHGNQLHQQIHSLHHTPTHIHDTTLEASANASSGSIRNTASPQQIGDPKAPGSKGPGSSAGASRPGSAAPEMHFNLRGSPSVGTPSNSNTPNYISYTPEDQRTTISNHNHTLSHTSNHSTNHRISNVPPSSSSHANSHASTHPNGSNHYEFGLENLSFIDGLNFEEGSSAFPPSEQPDSTPSLLAMKEGTVFASPMLPGQNDKSFNNQHYFHKNKGPSSAVNGGTGGNSANSGTPNSGGTVRPDAVFTPLVSPAVTPLDSQVNMNRAYSQPVQIKFEPLTSPALSAQSGDSSGNDRRRSSSSVYGPRDEVPAYTSTTYHKRRTPHGTPILAASKPSPSLKSRGGTANKQFEKLPDSSMEMLPPKKGGGSSNSGSHTGSNSAANSGAGNGSATGTPLMGFTMGRLAEQQSEEELHSTRSSRRSSFKNSSSDTSPVLDPQNRKEKPAAKKASHKLAEQGRRNRMNMAVHELASLVPQHYHDEVAIPSKATTVELASRYIRDLLADLQRQQEE